MGAASWLFDQALVLQEEIFDEQLGVERVLRERARLGEVKLIPGMPVEAFVQTGDRTMLSYLIKPFSDQLMRAFREK